jgi:hypothetical protein
MIGLSEAAELQKYFLFLQESASIVVKLKLLLGA